MIVSLFGLLKKVVVLAVECYLKNNELSWKSFGKVRSRASGRAHFGRGRELSAGCAKINA